MTILALDISTSCTGYCILSSELNSETSLIDIGFIPLSKQKSHYDKANLVLEDLHSIRVKHQITKIAIEENLQSFRSGFSSAQTLSSLAKFNGIVAYLCEHTFSVAPEFFNVNSARKSVGLKIVSKKKGGADTKIQVLDWAMSELSGFEWPTKTLKNGPRKNQVITHPGCYDMADAYVVARAAKLEHMSQGSL